MYSVITTAINCGMEAIPVRVEVDISDGMPVFEMVGFLTSEVKEARERVRTALKNSGFVIPAKRIVVNLTPADVRKSGNGCDLPVAAALLAALGYLDASVLHDYILVGEIGLDGSVLPVKGMLPAAILAQKSGYAGVIIPKENVREAAILDGIRVAGISTITELISLCDTGEVSASDTDIPTQSVWETVYDVDFQDVCGQPFARRACEIAVSGMHNLLLIGPPGAGKTMMARRIPTILPDLTKDEKLELSQIYSIAGLLDEKRILQKERPFRSPHHTITPQSMAGGGHFPRPGEVSLSHRGVLYLDEMPEFQRQALEVLREPLEDKKIVISRLGANYTFPSDFLLVGSMNPCPCGYYPNMSKCSCTPTALQNYINHISQALLNRIDLCVEVQELSYDQLQTGQTGEGSASIRARVERTHEIQCRRFQGTGIYFNSQMSAEQIQKYCITDQEAAEDLPKLYAEYQLSARTYHKLLKTARTIADMEGEPLIRRRHLREAILYRSPDKKYWRRY